MKLRILTTAVAATLAVAGLAGCRTNVGTAATVSGHKISESDVSNWVRPEGPSSAVVQNAQSSGQTVSPRSEVLQYLVQEQIFENALRKETGGVPSDGQLAALHDEAASTLLGTSLGGGELDSRLRQGLLGSGIDPSFSKVFLRVQELEYAIIVRNQLSQMNQLVALLKKSGATVRISPRYGTWSWDPTSFGLDGKVVTPDYLSVQPSAATG